MTEQPDRFVPVDLATFQRAVWSANRDGLIAAELRESLLRVSLDSDRGTGTNVRITDDAAADLRIAPRTLRERLRAAHGTWLLQTAKANRPGRDGVPRLARFRLQSPEPLAAGERDSCQRSSEPLARQATTVGSDQAGPLPSTSPHVRHNVRSDVDRKGSNMHRQQLDDETVRRIPQVANRYQLDQQTARQLVELAAADADTTYPVARLLQSPGYARHKLDQLAAAAHDELTAKLDELMGPQPDPVDEADELWHWRRRRAQLREQLQAQAVSS